MLLKIATLTLEMYCALHFHFHFHFILDSVGLIIAREIPRIPDKDRLSKKIHGTVSN
jgi:hypothetical protein